MAEGFGLEKPRPKRTKKLSQVEDLAEQIQRAVKIALGERDRQWMLATENHRRAWERKVSDVTDELDTQLHAVPFLAPPPVSDIEISINFQSERLAKAVSPSGEAS